MGFFVSPYLYLHSCMMKKILVIVLLLSFGFSHTTDLPSKVEIEMMSEQEKLLLYEEHKINPYYNTLISGLIPTYGHYRVNKWKRGLTILSLNVLAYFIESAPKNPKTGTVGNVSKKEAKNYAQVFSVILLGDTFYQTAIYNKNLYNIIFSTENSTQ